MASGSEYSSPKLRYYRRLPPTPHSIILSYGNALNFQRKFFLYAMKNRLADPSEICALDFKHEFGRSAACSVSATIGIDRSILADSARTTGWTGSRKKTVSPSSDDQLDENLAIGYLTACFCPLPPHINRRPIWNFASQASGRLHEIEQAFGKDQAQGPPDM